MLIFPLLQANKWLKPLNAPLIATLIPRIVLRRFNNNYDYLRMLDGLALPGTYSATCKSKTVIDVFKSELDKQTRN